jgi:hypothetical protein
MFKQGKPKLFGGDKWVAVFKLKKITAKSAEEYKRGRKERISSQGAKAK